MDPLRPFGTIIRSVWQKTVRRSEVKEPSPPSSAESAERIVPPADVEPLDARLRERLASQTHWNSPWAREVFVESVLLAEFGDHVQRDPAFADVVKKVSQQLASEPHLSARLDQLLRDVQRTANRK